MTGNPQFILHLGVHKSASTHFQQTLQSQSETLSAGGVQFYGPTFLRERGQTLKAMFGLKTKRRPVVTRTPAEQLTFLAQGGTHVLLSEENFLGHMLDESGDVDFPIYGEAAQNLGALAERLGDQPIKILIALRNPATYLNSVYSQRLFSGRIVSARAFVAASPLEKLDWVPLIEALASVRTVSEIVIWRYEDYPAIFGPLMRSVLPADVAGALTPEPQVVHAGLSAAAVEATLAGYAAGQGGDLAQDARRKFPVGSKFPKFSLFSQDIIDAEARRYDAQLAEIRKIAKVTHIRPDTRTVASAPKVRLEKQTPSEYVRDGSNKKDQTMAQGTAPAKEKRKRTNPLQFVQQTRAEIAKVVWPTRREVLLTTVMVTIMAIILALFFTLVDLAIRSGLSAVLTYFGS